MNQIFLFPLSLNLSPVAGVFREKEKEEEKEERERS